MLFGFGESWRCCSFLSQTHSTALSSFPTGRPPVPAQGGLCFWATLLPRNGLLTVSAAMNQRGKLLNGSSSIPGDRGMPRGAWSWGLRLPPSAGMEPVSPAFISGLPLHARPHPAWGVGRTSALWAPGAPKPPLASTASVCPQGLWLLFVPTKTSPSSDMSGFLRVPCEGQPHFPSGFCSPLLFPQNSDLAGA